MTFFQILRFLPGQLDRHAAKQEESVTPSVEGEVPWARWSGFGLAGHLRGEDAVVLAGQDLPEGLGAPSEDLPEVAASQPLAAHEEAPGLAVLVEPRARGRSPGRWRSVTARARSGGGARAGDLRTLLLPRVSRRGCRSSDEFTQLVATIARNADAEVPILEAADPFQSTCRVHDRGHMVRGPHQARGAASPQRRAGLSARWVEASGTHRRHRNQRRERGRRSSGRRAARRWRRQPLHSRGRRSRTMPSRSIFRYRACRLRPSFSAARTTTPSASTRACFEPAPLGIQRAGERRRRRRGGTSRFPNPDRTRR